MSSKRTALVKLDPKSTALQIVAELANGLVKAAGVYRRYIEAGGNPMELRRHAPVSADLWRTLDDVASDRIDPRALTLPGTAARAVRLLPRVTQADVIDHGVEVLSADGSTIRIPAAELTAQQSAQAFGPSGLRTASEQAAWVKTQQAASANVVVKAQSRPYDIYRDRVVIHAQDGRDVTVPLDMIREIASRVLAA